MSQHISSAIDIFAKSINDLLADNGSLAKLERRKATADALEYAAPQAGIVQPALRPDSMRNASGAPSNVDEALNDITTMFSHMPSGGGQQVAPPDWGSIYSQRANRQQAAYEQEDQNELARVDDLNKGIADANAQRASIGEQAIKAVQEESNLQSKYRGQDIELGANVQRAAEAKAAQGDKNAKDSVAQINSLFPEHERAGAYAYVIRRGQANNELGQALPPAKFAQYLEEYRTRSLREAPPSSPSSSAIDAIEDNMPPPPADSSDDDRGDDDDGGDDESTDTPVFEETLAAINRARVEAGGHAASPGEEIQLREEARAQRDEQMRKRQEKAAIDNEAYKRRQDKKALDLKVGETLYGRGKDAKDAQRQARIDAHNLPPTKSKGQQYFEGGDDNLSPKQLGEEELAKRKLERETAPKRKAELDAVDVETAEALSIIGEIEQLLTKGGANTGYFAGRLPTVTDPTRRVETLMGKLQIEALKAAKLSPVTETDVEFVKTTTVNTKASEEVNLTELAKLREIIQRKRVARGLDEPSANNLKREVVTRQLDGVTYSKGSDGQWRRLSR